jgi:thiamine biosynthesis lipoprotein
MVASYYDYAFKAMGSTIEIKAELDTPHQLVFKEIEDLFSLVETLASRFLQESELTYLNNHLDEMVTVHPIMMLLLKKAYQSYLDTNGMFDPRILKALQHSGYSQTFKDNEWHNVKTIPLVIRNAWTPEFKGNKVNIGTQPIDLGGIGKSYTVELASDIIKQYSQNFFINAGGDVLFSGNMEEGKPWTVGVENPYDIDADSVAILEVNTMGVATSSKARNYWETPDKRKWHHIINPFTGQPTDTGVQAVTVLNNDLITAEVWTKTLMMYNSDEIARIADEKQLPAMWFDKEGRMHYNEHIRPFISWTI